ncbi:membrane-bound lytic murein transglycosylase MltF [Corallincola luteus]|uniref:Membrane-bound lytic murein transglycosylase F n=1 Tax=Corallincola luteus TaxID=1775177 RepID=A0ABY2AQ53_9GAMM|nr:membrane-bound lytic murein transglycosylase MltF [Corallincola luteus]TCI05329.1 membrane-bound lytic murein transglycosylase MltF [Corallincola luteus]
MEITRQKSSESSVSSRLFRGWKRQILLVSLFLTSLLLLGCDPTQPDKTHLQQILDRGELRVGTIYSSTTYLFGPNGPEGIDYELAKQLADYLGVELKMVPSYTIDDLFTQLNAGRVDILAAGLAVTDQRREFYSFSPAYQWISQKVVYKKGRKRPRNLGQLDGVIRVIANSSHAETLERFKTDYPNLDWEVTTEHDSEELMQKVLAGDIDFTIVDSSQLDLFRRYHTELSLAFTVVKEQPVAWLMQKGNNDALQAALIEFFGEMQSSGMIAQLEEKYFGHVGQFDYVDTRAFMRAVERKLPSIKPMFEQYAAELDWRLLAAQSYQESHWNPNARSHTGVRGLMMLTLNTAKQLKIENRLDPESSIRGGAIYLEQLLQRVPEKIAPHERIWFALAAYNVGMGHVIDAIKLTRARGKDPYSWTDVKTTLPLLRKKKWYKQTRYGYARGEEPVAYVDNIRRYYDALVYIEDKKAAADRLAQQKEKFKQLTAGIKEYDGDAADNKVAEKSAPEEQLKAVPER